MAKVVICEDDPVILKLLHLALRESGHELLTASDGMAGLALIERERPDAVITDVMMPRMNGLELLDAIRARSELAEIPILFLSASPRPARRDEGRRHGATAYLTKPFRTAELRAALARMLEPAAPAPD